MKKIVIILSLILTIFAASVSYVNATTCEIAMAASKTNFNKGEEIVVSVSLAKLKSDVGIIALDGTLEYDKQNLEYVKMEGQNGWSTPVYNSSNGKFVTDKNAFATKNETVFKIIFKVKQTQKQNQVITLKDVTVADGVAPISTKESNFKFTINTGASKPNDNVQKPNINTNGDNPLNLITGSNNIVNDAVTGQLPQTGISDVMITILLIGAVITAAVFFIKIKEMK